MSFLIFLRRSVRLVGVGFGITVSVRAGHLYFHPVVCSSFFLFSFLA